MCACVCVCVGEYMSLLAVTVFSSYIKVLSSDKQVMFL